jgi:cysteine desulfurase
VDAIQAFGKIDISVNDLNVDLISISAHKIYGPKGAGALYIRSGTQINNLVFGGSQERVIRAGTENLSGIAGFGVAAEQMTLHKNERENIKNLRDSFEEKLESKIPGFEVHCKNSHRTYNISNVFFPSISINSLLLNLDLERIACSAGSACSSGSITTSHVLSAMNFPIEHANQSIRFSFGRFNTMDEIDKAVKIILEIYNRLKQE